VVQVVAAKGEVAEELDPSAVGELSPVALTLGFDSRGAGRLEAQELSRVELDVGRRVHFFHEGLPSCPLADLYREQRPCRRSVVGRGSVAALIAPAAGATPVGVEGRLVAYFNQTHRQARILARVVTGEPLPLVFVIPFSIKPANGAYGSKLLVRRMRRIVGKCAASHPNCFADPYALKGAYGRIASFEMTLSRRFRSGEAARGFVEADCPAPRGRMDATLPLVRATLTYTDGSEASPVEDRLCRVAG
jgi:hypothetical protein